MSLLDSIHSPLDIRTLTQNQLHELADELRNQIINTVAKTGGHLAPNLGVVELTLAIHKVFNTTVDKVVFDVGHQSYVHKLLTGRQKNFHTLRQYQGLSGFPSRAESEHDAFGTGHSSTSISAAVGLALARDLNGQDHNILAVIGDGALTGGMAFEALNHVGHLGTNLTVILNDNEMSIGENVGGMAKYLTRIRTDPKYTRGKDEVENLLKKLPMGKRVFKIAERLKDSFKYLVVPGVLFEELGFTYLGPIDGHNIGDMVDTLKVAKTYQGPVLIHVITRKGKGYLPAEENPDKFHGIGPFDPDTGQGAKKSTQPTYTEIFSDTLLKIADDNDKVLAITAAMSGGTGLKPFASKYPSRFFDVGIAEQHAITMAAALAAGGFTPVVAIYSTFLQRGLDQVLHDVCIQNLPVVLAIDRAGIVGEDGATHQGVFDITIFRGIPNLTIMAPKDENELQHMLNTAIELPGPCAIRYPRGRGTGCEMDATLTTVPVGQAEVLCQGNDLTIVAVGNMVAVAEEAVETLAQLGVQATLINARFIKPLDAACLTHYASQTKHVLTIEEHILAGGFGSAVIELLQLHGLEDVRVVRVGIPDEYVEHGAPSIIRDQYGLNRDNLVKEALNLLGKQAKLMIQ